MPDEFILAMSQGPEVDELVAALEALQLLEDTEVSFDTYVELALGTLLDEPVEQQQLNPTPHGVGGAAS